jgi:riboflavin synthase
MFTGLIETIGTVRSLERRTGGLVLGIQPHAAGFMVGVGGSVAIDGVCLSLERGEGESLLFTAVAETLGRTTLGGLRVGAEVNMERALRLDSRLDGHIVLGHVDEVGKILADRTVGESLERRILFPPALRPFMAVKGSVAIDGISLTIAACVDDAIAVALIPLTLRSTTMPRKRPGDRVNIECDVLARYIFRMVGQGAGSIESAGPAGGEARGESLLSILEKYRF